MLFGWGRSTSPLTKHDIEVCTMFFHHVKLKRSTHTCTQENTIHKFRKKWQNNGKGPIKALGKTKGGDSSIK